MPKRIWMVISIVLTVLLGISLYFQCRKNYEANMYRQTFVNNLYYGLDDCINLLSIVGESDSAALKDSFQKTVNQLERLDSIMEDASHFMDRDIKYNLTTGNFGRIGIIIDKGYGFNNQKIFDGFLEDGKLSDKELMFLSSLKEDLKQIRSKMYSDKTKQENPELTIQQVNEIVSPLFIKYCELYS